MLLDRLVRLILPRQGQFFTLLEGIGEQIVAGAGILDELRKADGHSQLEVIAVRLKDVEKKADELERGLHRELDRTFVTPIDREDLAHLAKALDDVVDGMEHAATFAALYQFEHLTDPMRELVRITAAAARELAGAVPLLRQFGAPEAVNGRTLAVHTLEAEADGVYRAAVAGLFTGGLPATDVVRQKDMLTALEAAADECEDAMDVIRSVMVKNG